MTRARGSEGRRDGLFLSLVLVASAGACDGRAVASGPDLTHAGACPFRTAGEWQAFLDGAAGDDAWEKTCDDDGCDAATYDAVEANVAGVLASCAGLLADNPPLAACVDRLRRFTSSWLSQHDLSSYGFTTDDAAYFAAQVAPSNPQGMMTPPSALLSAMPDLDQVIGAARTAGWPYVVQASCLGDVRIFVLTPDPAGRFDQVDLDEPDPILLLPGPRARPGLLPRGPEDGRRGRGPAEGPRPLPRSARRAVGGRRNQRHEQSQDNAKCYACHPSGVRHLVAVRTPSLAAKPVLGEPGYPGDGPADFAFQRLTAMNDRLTSYGLTDWNGTIVPADHGPALGVEEGCTACHDGQVRGALTVSTSRNQLARKVVTELAMPPVAGLPQLVERQTMNNPPLSPTEAAALADAEAAHATLLAGLDAASAPALVRWLLETPCE